MINRQLTELQKKLLPMLAWYHDFCVQNGLKYYLLGGTMLGATRHQGFIPWDDDIDVGMPRKEYEKFLELTADRLFGDYLVEGIETNQLDFYYGYSKIYDTSTTLVENTRYQIKRGIYIDVFPLDGVTNDKSEIKHIYQSFARRYGLLLARTCAIRESRKWYKNLAIMGSRVVPGINDKRLMMKIDARCKQRDYDSCEYVGNFYGNWGVREIVKKEVMGTPTIYTFEQLKVYGVSDYDAYLTSLYGNWRQLPPKEKQVTHHDYVFIDLNKSYV